MIQPLFQHAAIVGMLIAGCACGADALPPGDAGPPEGDDASLSLADTSVMLPPGDAGPPERCDSGVELLACGSGGHGTPEEIAATPRADTNLELLALSMSDGFTADPTVYERIVRDVAAIRAIEPAVAGIGYFPPHGGRTILLSMSSHRMVSVVENGAYHAWDCLNAHYGLESIQTFTLIPLVAVTLKGIYDLDIVARDYRTLPGVVGAEPSGSLGDGSTICIGATAGCGVTGEVWDYVFDEAGGDCPAGCTVHIYRHFTTTPAGGVEAHGFFDPYSIDPRPEWFDRCGLGW